ncbi:hypothetical protein BLNAU_21998 [Blattamonas nauphoetae]|uniref:Uncharacterized protein n=1 Tax=Blattamonas nauphoetae TaxID=2049346 RepID=A0ABQ9WVD3_9EUKA|nr:hypothetical protein BLNAU_21998 [Blattamonas nauphoetae]
MTTSATGLEPSNINTSDNSTAFLNWNASTRFSVDSASITFQSLVTLVKEGYPFDDALEAKAIGFLGHIDTHFKRSEDDNLLFKLVHAHDDPVAGFLDALLSLLASSSHMIVESALEILHFVTTFLDSFVPMMRAWRIADPHTVGKGKTIIRALNNEGFDDVLDQTLFKVKPEYHRFGSPSIDHFAEEFGANYLPAIPLYM